MTFVHGKHTVVKLGVADLSVYTNTTTFNRSKDALETTTYGKDSKTYRGGLKDGKITIGGTYDDGASGPAAIIQPHLDDEAPTTFTFQPDGAGTTKDQTVVDVVVTAFNVSSPVAEMVQWTCEMQASDDADDTPQT